MVLSRFCDIYGQHNRSCKSTINRRGLLEAQREQQINNIGRSQVAEESKVPIIRRSQ